MRVLSIGGATLDTIIEYEQMAAATLEHAGHKETFLMLEEGSKIEVTKQKTFSGGGATNAAVSFLKQGLDVQLFCKIGQDSTAEHLIEELQSYGLDTSGIQRTNDSGTATSFVVPSLSGDRALFAYRGANTHLLTEELPLTALQDSDFVYVTSLSRESAARLPEIARAAKDHHVPVAINPGSSQLKLGSGSIQSSLGDIDALIMNFEEAKQFMGVMQQCEDLPLGDSQQAPAGLLHHPLGTANIYFELKQFFKTILNSGPSVVTVTNGSDGVYVATASHLYYHKAHANTAINTLGAGDAFGSSFSGAYYMGLGVETAIRWGIVNAASVIAQPDAKSGLLTRTEIEGKISQLPPTDLIIQPWEAT